MNVQSGTPQRGTALDVGVLLGQHQLSSRGDAASAIARIEGTTLGLGMSAALALWIDRGNTGS